MIVLAAQCIPKVSSKIALPAQYIPKVSSVDVSYFLGLNSFCVDYMWSFLGNVSTSLSGIQGNAGVNDCMVIIYTSGHLCANSNLYLGLVLDKQKYNMYSKKDGSSRLVIHD
jgi:hypothetical protein